MCITLVLKNDVVVSDLDAENQSHANGNINQNIGICSTENFVYKQRLSLIFSKKCLYGEGSDVMLI